MAVYKENGKYSGKVGSVILCNWKGIDYIRSLPEKVNRQPTPKEKSNRERFRLGTRLMQGLSPVLRIGFRSAPTKGTPLNAALSDIMKNAVMRPPDKIGIDYKRLRIAAGILQGPQNIAVKQLDNSLIFTWDDNSYLGDASPNDWAMLVALAENGRYLMTNDQYTRKECLGKLQIRGSNKNIEKWHCYIAFLGINKEDVSTSNYCGTVRCFFSQTNNNL
jgi:hypothetical protein